MNGKLVSGVYAAALTPRRADGSLDEPSLRNELEFLMGRGIRGFAINGATGEYCLTSPDELAAIVRIVSEVTEGRAEFVCGIGAAGLSGCLKNGAIAIGGGAKGLLLPMPHFFPYQQDDLESFCLEVAAELPSPILLYNLPRFTTGLEPETVHALIAECPNIVGIKDSSGSLDILRALSQSDLDACRIVGSDNALAQALTEKVCDGVISGVACALPELMLTVFANGADPDSVAFRQSTRLLLEFIAAVSPFPVPWALKWIAASRGIVPATFAQPLSPRRRQQACELQGWFQSWMRTAGI